VNVRRREFIALFGGVAAVWPFRAHAQQHKKIPRLCFLTFDPGTAESPSPRFDAFFESLRELGYVNGQTLTLDYLSAKGRNELFPSLAADCVRLQADIIVVSTTPAAHAAKKATTTIPIVMGALGDPVGTKLVDSLARPGGNVTGMSLMASGLAAKRLELLKEALPGISRVLVLSYLVDPIAPLQVQALKEAAPSLGLTLQIQDIRTADDLPAAFDAGSRERCQGLLVTAESIFLVERARVTALAARHEFPAIYPFAEFVVDSGGLMAYHVIEPVLYRHAATYVDLILKGAKPSDLAVQQPSNVQLIINQRTAKTLGVTVAPSLLARADEVIE
jgi:putative ABC transport system substrate-binding protein